MASMGSRSDRLLAAFGVGQRGFIGRRCCAVLGMPDVISCWISQLLYMCSQALAAMQGEHAALGAALDEIKKRKDAAKKAVAALTNEQRKARTRCAPRTCRA